jgi:serine/threonine protein kinase
MLPDRWNEVKDKLDEALQREPAGRALYLAEVGAVDPDLQRELESLIAAHERPRTDFLNTPMAQVTSVLADVAPVPLPGRRIGCYQIVRQIGVGGMGEVYGAFRADDEYRKQVAIKLVRSDQGSEFVFNRFKSERQILACLDHPNIARLLDGGTTEEGLPYFVMELIEGNAIDDYCDTCKLSIIDRLKLFLQVCSAVQFAHQYLVIHRDIKPGNILVTSDGIPKLLDFGIAKILEGSSVGADADATLTAFRVLTPGFASPEQIKGERITTASDVYSLGVVLYKLLSGDSPYRVTNNNPQDISRAVCEFEPEKPSLAARRASARDANNTSGLDQEGASLAKLGKQLKGDLDNIVLKALRKEPQRRYASVEEFARDIRRHLDNLPVIARKDTLGYRTSKFIRRHTAGLVVAGAFALVLTAGVAMIVREARLAERRFNDVRKLANSVIFDLPKPIHTLPGAVAVEKTLYENGLKYLDGLAAESTGDESLQRELAAGYKQLADSLGSPYAANLGDVNRAQAAYRKALEVRERIAKSNPNSLPDQLELAKLYRTVGYQSYLSGDVASGHDYVHKALAISKPIADTHDENIQALGELSTDLLTVGNVDGEVWDNGLFGDPDIALSYYIESVKVAQKIAGRQQATDLWVRQTIYMLTTIAWNHVAAGRPAQAIDSARQAFEILSRLHPADPAASLSIANERAQIHSAIGQAYLLSGHPKEAAAEWKSALPVYQQLYDPQDFRARETLAGGYAGWGHAESDAGDTRSGLRHIRQCLGMVRPASAQGSGEKYSAILTAQFYSYEGEALERSGTLSEAIAAYERALERSRAPELSRYPHVGLLVAGELAAIARVRARLRGSEQARAGYEEAMRLAEPAAASNPPNLYAQYLLFDVYAGLGRLAPQSVNAGDRVGGVRSEACGWYQKSMDTWQSLRAHLATAPNELRVTDYRTVAAQLARCRQ